MNLRYDTPQRKWAHKMEIRQEGWHIKRLKNCRRFIRVFECFSFISILEYRKIGKTLPKCILFLQNMILNRALRSIRCYFVFKEFCCLLVLSPRIWMRFSKKILLHQLKK